MRLTRSARVTALAAALSLAAVACGGSDEPTVVSEGDGSVSATATGTEDPTEEGTATAELTLVNEGQLTLCSDVPYAPFEVEKEDGSGYTGFDIELMRAVADDLGLQLEVVNTAFDPIQSGTALAAGECDVAASAISITEEREANLDFSEPYYAAEQSLATTPDSGITSLGDTAGRRIGVQSATTGEAYAQEHATEAEIVSFENPGDLFTALAAGDVDAILQDLPVNAEQARDNDGIEVVETYDTGENYGFAVAEEGADELLDAINQALGELRENGTYDELYDEYFSAE